MNVADSYLLPSMDDFIDSLGNEGVFKYLRCNRGYWKVLGAEKD